MDSFDGMYTDYPLPSTQEMATRAVLAESTAYEMQAIEAFIIPGSQTSFRRTPSWLLNLPATVAARLIEAFAT